MTVCVLNQVEKVMDVFYKANVTDGLFHDEWSMRDGSPSGRKFLFFPIPNDIIQLVF